MNDLTIIKNQQAAMLAPHLGEYNAAARIIIQEMKEAGAAPEEIIGFLKGLYEPFGIPVEDEFEPDEFGFAAEPEQEQPVTYSATQIARMLGVYSEFDRPHAHAVSAILNHNINIGDEHKYVYVLFETCDLTVYCTRYDGYALERVLDWVEANGLPYAVDGRCYTYYVQYKDTAA